VIPVVLGLGLLVAWPIRPRRVRAMAPPAGESGRPDRRLLAVALAAVLTAVASPLLGLAVLAVVAGRPRWSARREAARRRWAIVDGVPEAADLFALAVSGGLSVSMAVGEVARWAPGPVGEAFVRAGRSLRLGRPAADVLDDVAADLGAPIRPLVDVLAASERYGVPLGAGLDRVAREARLERRRRGEERARRVPVLLLFPLVLCVLPAFGFLTVVPLLVGSLPDLPP
jgi:tight adherence protein C